VDRKNGKINSRGEPKLSAQVKRMPSIRKSDADKGGRGDLIQAVRGNCNKRFARLPTVTAQDVKNDGGPSQSNRHTRPLNLIVKRWPTVRTQSKTGGGSGLDGGSGARRMMTDAERQERNGGSLNPPWVEWLMGWPIGWTDLHPLEMDKFQQWLSSHGIF